MIQHLDPVVNRLLVSDGYTIINDFLKPAQITQLKDLYSGIKQTETKGKMYSNIQDLGYDACMRIEEAIMNICEESVKKHFKHYKIAACSFLVKGYGRAAIPDFIRTGILWMKEYSNHMCYGFRW